MTITSTQSPTLGSDPKPRPRSTPRDLGDGRQYADLLEREDRLLLELTQTGLTHRAIARILRASPGSVSRKLHRLGRRMHDPISVRLLDPRCPLSPDFRQIGVEYFFIGKPVSRIATEKGLSFTSIRQTIDEVRLWHRVTRSFAQTHD